MTKITVSKARDQLPELVNRVGYGQERIVLERRGKPVAALVSLEDVARLEAFEDARDSALLLKAMKDSLGFITIEELLADRPID
jgi:prevent-host-death family protein